MRKIGRVDVGAYLKGTLELHFRVIVLTQDVDDDPIVFSGPGTVYLDQGHLSYIIHHGLKGDENIRLLRSEFSGAPGQIVGRDQYYRFSGVDIYGQSWESIGVDARGGEYTPFASVVKGTMECLRLEPKENSKAWERIEYYLLPNTHFLAPLIRPEAGFECVISGVTVKSRLESEFCYVSLLGGGVGVEFGRSVLNSLDVMSGTLCSVAVVEFFCDKKYWVELHSYDTSLPNRQLSVPVEIEYSIESELYEGILNRLCPFFLKEGGRYYDYWFKLNRVWQGGIPPASLTIGIYIEGVLSTYFDLLGRDSEFHDLAKSCIPKIKDLNIDGRVKDLLRSSIGNAGHFKAKNALRKLVEMGAITSGLADKWTRLRNNSAHAVPVGSTTHDKQALIDLTYCNLKLFYELLFHLAQYDGPRVDYGSVGHPTIPGSNVAGVKMLKISDGHIVDTSAGLTGRTQPEI